MLCNWWNKRILPWKWENSSRLELVRSNQLDSIKLTEATSTQASGFKLELSYQNSLMKFLNRFISCELLTLWSSKTWHFFAILVCILESSENSSWWSGASGLKLKLKLMKSNRRVQIETDGIEVVRSWTGRHEAQLNFEWAGQKFAKNTTTWKCSLKPNWNQIETKLKPNWNQNNLKCALEKSKINESVRWHQQHVSIKGKAGRAIDLGGIVGQLRCKRVPRPKLSFKKFRVLVSAASLYSALERLHVQYCRRYSACWQKRESLSHSQEIVRIALLGLQSRKSLFTFMSQAMQTERKFSQCLDSSLEALNSRLERALFTETWNPGRERTCIHWSPKISIKANKVCQLNSHS